MGEITTSNDPVFLSLLNFTTLPDSEIALYDDQGFLISTNDDFDFDSAKKLLFQVREE